MTYKVGDLVYFESYWQKGVGKIVGKDKDGDYLVNSTQIEGVHTGNLHGVKQDNKNNWLFSVDYLKPFTKKVGQKYKVIRNSASDFEIGDIVTLHHIDDECVSHYKKDSVGNHMYDIDHVKCELEFYADAEEQKENEVFTKDDLQVGYLVKLRNGQIAHVVDTQKEGLCLNFVDSWDDLDNYNRDLTNTKLCFLDIDEVYGLTKYGIYAHKFEVGNRELLWKREEVKEMTIEDIQKALGHKIKVVE